MTWFCIYCRTTNAFHVEECSTCGKHDVPILPASESALRFVDTVTVENPYDDDPDTDEVYTVIRRVMGKDFVEPTLDAGQHSKTKKCLFTDEKEQTDKAKDNKNDGKDLGVAQHSIHQGASFTQSDLELYKTPEKMGTTSEIKSKNAPKKERIDEAKDNKNIEEDLGMAQHSNAKRSLFTESGSEQYKTTKKMEVTSETKSEDDHDHDLDVVAYVKCTPLYGRELATVITPVRLLDYYAGYLPSGVKLVNDFDGTDPNRLFLELEDDAEEIPDIILDASWQGMNEYVAGHSCEQVIHENDEGISKLLKK